MSNKKTLYIVGAGASREAKLPTAHELKTKISDLLNIQSGEALSTGDGLIYEAIRKHVQKSGFTQTKVDQYVKASWHIRDAMPQAISIDNFINTHTGDEKIELCGKLAIVCSILDAERSSLLYDERTDPRYFQQGKIAKRLYFSSLEETWYANFMKLLTENCTKEDLTKRLESIVFVVFNYDRCIEHFLYHSLQNYYGCEPEEAGELVKEIEIYHPYGVVGSLPWQDGQSVEFGAKLSSQKLLNVAQQIRTFTEGTDPQSSNILAIRKNVLKANPIVFLGFAYNKLNMKLLSPDGPIFDSSKLSSCFGTAIGISKRDCEIIKREISPSYKRTMRILEIRNDLDCHGLFTEYWRNLSLN